MVLLAVCNFNENYNNLLYSYIHLIPPMFIVWMNNGSIICVWVYNMAYMKVPFK